MHESAAESPHVAGGHLDIGAAGHQLVGADAPREAQRLAHGRRFGSQLRAAKRLGAVQHAQSLPQDSNRRSHVGVHHGHVRQAHGRLEQQLGERHAHREVDVPVAVLERLGRGAPREHEKVQHARRVVRIGGQRGGEEAVRRKHEPARCLHPACGSRQRHSLVLRGRVHPEAKPRLAQASEHQGVELASDASSVRLLPREAHVELPLAAPHVVAPGRRQRQAEAGRGGSGPQAAAPSELGGALASERALQLGGRELAGAVQPSREDCPGAAGRLRLGRGPRGGGSVLRLSEEPRSPDQRERPLVPLQRRAPPAEDRPGRAQHGAARSHGLDVRDDDALRVVVPGASAGGRLVRGLARQSLPELLLDGEHAPRRAKRHVEQVSAAERVRDRESGGDGDQPQPPRQAAKRHGHVVSELRFERAGSSRDFKVGSCGPGGGFGRR
mmetsp:Transcript_7900/g.31210  ORF Transcript_7900/g.31210 Transcript_7900/m.31210 type:complete len:441 (-) Transcript_7900:7293-8615(-)